MIFVTLLEMFVFSPTTNKKTYYYSNSAVAGSLDGFIGRDIGGHHPCVRNEHTRTHEHKKGGV